MEFTREAFISHPHQVLAIRLTSSVEKGLNVNITLDSLLKYRTSNAEEEVILQGVCPEACAPTYFHENDQPIIYGEFGETKAIHFEGRLGVVVENGHVESGMEDFLFKMPQKPFSIFQLQLPLMVLINYQGNV